MTYNPYLLMLVYALSHILLGGLISTVPSAWTWKKRVFFLFSTYFLPNAGIPFLSTPFQDSISLPMNPLSSSLTPPHLLSLSSNLFPLLDSTIALSLAILFFLNSASALLENQSQWPKDGTFDFKIVQDCDNFCYYPDRRSKFPYL